MRMRKPGVPSIALLLLIASGLSGCASAPVEQIPPFLNLPRETLAATRWESGDTTISNEARLDLFRPALERARGGAYLGVGGLQNFTLAAWAKSEEMFLIDFTATVVTANRIQLALIAEIADGAKFREAWENSGRDIAHAVIEKHFEGARAAGARAVYARSAPHVRRYFRRMDRVRETYKYAAFYDDPKAYAYVRRLVQEDHVHSLEGNLLGQTTMRGIGAALRRANMPLRVLYFSNAEEYQGFHPYPGNFVINVLSLPADERSVVLRTVSLERKTLPWAPGSPLLTDRGFHYGVQSLGLMQDWLLGPKTDVLRMYRAGRREGAAGLTIMDALPGKE